MISIEVSEGGIRVRMGRNSSIYFQADETVSRLGESNHGLCTFYGRLTVSPNWTYVN